ncbi:TonB-dependent receptor [Sphingopyxis yananensis]|uniref:TonB-dependent receptor n=1 Tax=Sphingopyxis yananensis TaxID=2886687 RepID=UPI001D116110|nr:TonB-dependent receptor [Sphingopyxis yananensis]MCC2601298.1 TonB-dependent receptor [Sphingopyxis yananensis]
MMDSIQKITRSKQLYFGISLIAATASLHAPSAAAQETSQAQNTAETTSYPGEIVVTALKRATSIQQTPIAISAVDSAALERQNITDSSALGRVTPGLVINEGANGGSRVIIRNLYATGESLVGLYYDEIPLSGTGGVSNDSGGSQPSMRLFDIERAEVMRGPQGTLYGASAMGGNIRVIFAKPKLDRYEGALDAQLNTVAESGGALGMQTNAMVNVPIVQDVLAVRAVGFYDKGAGYMDNSLLGRDRINESESFGGRITARFQPVSEVTLDLMAVYQDRTGAGSSWNYTKYQLTGEKFDQTLLMQQPQHDRMKLFSGTLNWDMGFATLTATASYSDRFLGYKFDYTPYFSRYQSVNNTGGLVPPFTGNPTTIPGYNAFVNDCNTGYMTNVTCDGAGYQQLVNSYGNMTTFQPQSNKTSTQEIRIADDRNAVKWTLGLYHSYRKNYTQSLLSPTDPVTGLQTHPIGYANGDTFVVGVNTTGLDRTIDDRLEQIAAFGEITWEATDKLSLTGGLRYFDYKKNTTSEVLVPSYIAGSVRQDPLTTGGKEHGTLLKFNASYKFNPTAMAYVTASQGYRPGGVNQTLGLPSYAAVYSSDSVWNYEVGLKTSWFDRKLVFNIDAFRMDWKNMQVSASYNNAFSFITNSSSAARIQGIEFDTAFYPVDRLSLSLSGSYIKAKLQGDQSLPSGITTCPVPFVEGTTGCATIGAGKKGDTIPYSPKWTIQASADYSTPIGNDLQIIYHADLSYRGSSLTTYNLPRYAAAYPNGPVAGTDGGAALYTLPAYTTVGARIGLEKEDGNWGVYLFANNLFNEMGLMALTNGQASATQLPWQYQGSVVRPNYAVTTSPRTVGLQVTAKFR